MLAKLLLENLNPTQGTYRCAYFKAARYFFPRSDCDSDQSLPSSIEVENE